VYSWILRRLPFGLPGRIIGSLLLVSAAAALMWYQLFPNIEQYMPFTDGQITTSGGDNPGANTVDPSAGPSGLPADVIPYSTVSNAPAPTKTR
jgi:hypothetical protein